MLRRSRVSYSRDRHLVHGHPATSEAVMEARPCCRPLAHPRIVEGT